MTTEAFIGREEGFSREAYHDTAGYPTIGFGRKLSNTKWADLSQWEPVDQDEEADRHFAPDVARFRSGVRQRVHTYGLTADQETALVSLAYNIGLGVLTGTRLQRLLNADATTRASDTWRLRVAMEWVDWHNITLGGRKQASAGLVDRRRREIAFFFGFELEQ